MDHDQLAQTLTNNVNKLAQAEAAFRAAIDAANRERVQAFSAIDLLSTSVYDQVAPAYRGIEAALQKMQMRMEAAEAALRPMLTLLQEAAAKEAWLFAQLVKANPGRDLY